VVKMGNKEDKKRSYPSFEILVNNSTCKLTLKALIESTLFVLSEEILPESEKRELLKLCIKYNSTDEEIEKKELFFNENDIGVIYRDFKLINRDMSIFNEAVKHATEKILKYTKHDTVVTKDTLSQNEVIQALNASISKFIELYYQQPRELKHTLIDYKETAIKDYILVTQNAINHDKDIKLLDKLFLTYKRDTQGRIYNYDLFAFIYYAYGLEISFNHLYHSELLKFLGAYNFKADRDKPVLKKNAITILQQHKEAVKLTQYSENIYLHNFITFIKTVNTKHYNKYLLSVLVNMSHNLKASKEFIQSLTCKDSFKNDTYKNLPQPINTILLPSTQIAN